MKIGNYKISFNYGILRGFLDIMGLILAYLCYQTTYAFVDKYINPDMVLMNIYHGAMPIDRIVIGLIPSLLAAAVLVFSVVYMFIPHRLPERYNITEENAQKYYDTLMTANSILRILSLLAIWDYMYIVQSNMMFSGVSWFSIQTVLDIAVGTLAVYILRNRVKSFADVKTAIPADESNEPKQDDKQDLSERSEKKTVRLKVKAKDDDDDDKMIMRS